jgi:hypothetical protein
MYAPPAFKINDEAPALEDASRQISKDLAFLIPPTLWYYQFWGPTFLILIFLGLLMGVLAWLYVYINFTSYQDRITVLSLGNLFNQDPQARFKTYIQQSTQESIAAAMRDITSSSNDVKTSVNRLETQVAANQSTIFQPLLDTLTSFLGSKFLVDPNTVKTTQQKNLSGH